MNEISLPSIGVRFFHSSIAQENHGHLRGWVVENEPVHRDRGPDAQRGHERARRSGGGRGGAELSIIALRTNRLRRARRQ